MLVVLDTNVLVSGLAYPGGPPGRLVSAWRGGAFRLASSDFVLRELTRVLPTMSARTGMSPNEVRDFLDAFRAAASWVEPGADSLAQAQATGLRDPNDVPILAMLIAAGADCLVSGDKDLLVLADRYPILTPADFCARHAP
jgi:putative PIN family toxin of toxin-antitoxin system